MRFFGAAQKLERTFVPRAFADLAIETRHRFGIVIENVGPDGEDGVQGLPVAAEIGDQHFHFAARNAAPDLFDGARKDVRAAVGLIVAVDRSNYGITQTHASDGFRHTMRLLFVRRAGRFTGRHRAETTRARADVS